MEWPFDQPARSTLKPPGETGVPWAVFDAPWYRHTHRLPADADAADLLNHYLTAGQAAGHSPNPWFAERWHRRTYPAIAAAVAGGEYASAFDAYCRRGNLDRSAHWLFDELFYRDRHPDLTAEALARAQVANGYGHYLRCGDAEGRTGHPLFDPQTYLANFDPADIPDIRRTGGFRHFLMQLRPLAPERRTSIYFDPWWYRRRYPEVDRAIVAGRWTCALHHYLCNDTPSAFDPLDGFSESHYLRNDPALLDVVENGDFRNGYRHFLLFGVHERRSPASWVDLAWYAEQGSVRTDIAAGRAPDPFAHWLGIGLPAGLPSAPRGVGTMDAAADLHRRAAAAVMPATARFGSGFAASDAPQLSVVLIAQDRFPLLLSTIASLHAAATMPTELIIVDRASSDEVRFIGDHVPGARVLRLDPGRGWADAAEAGRRLARSDLVLFLSGTAAAAAGTVDRAAHRLRSDPAIGAVGGLALQPDGTILAAGGMVWRNGEATSYLRGQPALSPEAQFARPVDFVSACFLLCRTAPLATLGGFDPACSDGYAVVDLCLRIAAAGSRVFYDPSVVVQETVPTAAAGHPDDRFRGKHRTRLATRAGFPGSAASLLNRFAAPPPALRILFIEDTVPLRRIGSGFVRSNDIVRALAGLGASVTVFPVDGCRYSPAQVFADLPDTVEAMHDHSLEQLGGFLDRRAEYYHLAWVARPHNLRKVGPMLAAMQSARSSPARVIFDTEALVPYRDAQRAALSGRTLDPEPAMRAMLADAAACDVTVGVTPAETALLQRFGFPRPVTVGHGLAARPTPRRFAERADLLFVGAIHAADAPNLDSLHWFADRVLPTIEQTLGRPMRLTIAGHVAPGIDMRRLEQDTRVVLCGPQPSLAALYDSHRVFVAPTRFAAGAPFKVLEAAAFGLPVVGTEILRAQLDWIDRREIIAVDPTDPSLFAEAVCSLYVDETLWQTIRDGALRRLRQAHTQEGLLRSVAQVLAAAGLPMEGTGDEFDG